MAIIIANENTLIAFNQDELNGQPNKIKKLIEHLTILGGKWVQQGNFRESPKITRYDLLTLSTVYQILGLVDLLKTIDPQHYVEFEGYPTFAALTEDQLNNNDVPEFLFPSGYPQEDGTAIIPKWKDYHNSERVNDFYGLGVRYQMALDYQGVKPVIGSHLKELTTSGYDIRPKSEWVSEGVTE